MYIAGLLIFVDYVIHSLIPQYEQVISSIFKLPHH